jgi:hypothetical protein
MIANDNCRDAAPDDVETTDLIEVCGRTCETAAVCAYPGHVIVELDDGMTVVDVHLPAVQARRYVAAILTACEDAERMAQQTTPH